MRDTHARSSCQNDITYRIITIQSDDYGDDVMSDTIDRMILTMSDTATSTYNLSEKHT